VVADSGCGQAQVIQAVYHGPASRRIGEESALHLITCIEPQDRAATVRIQAVHQPLQHRKSTKPAAIGVGLRKQGPMKVGGRENPEENSVPRAHGHRPGRNPEQRAHGDGRILRHNPPLVASVCRRIDHPGPLDLLYQELPDVLTLVVYDRRTPEHAVSSGAGLTMTVHREGVAG
jgi:hypothetical protein